MNTGEELVDSARWDDLVDSWVYYLCRMPSVTLLDRSAKACMVSPRSRSFCSPYDWRYADVRSYPQNTMRPLLFLAAAGVLALSVSRLDARPRRAKSDDAVVNSASRPAAARPAWSVSGASRAFRDRLAWSATPAIRTSDRLLHLFTGRANLSSVRSGTGQLSPLVVGVGSASTRSGRAHELRAWLRCVLRYLYHSVRIHARASCRRRDDRDVQRDRSAAPLPNYWRTTGYPRYRRFGAGVSRARPRRVKRLLPPKPHDLGVG